MDEEFGPAALTRDLTRRGYDPRKLKQLVQAGEIDHVRRGVYPEPLPLTDHPDERQRDEHRRLVRGALQQLAPDACVSHTSAAAFHDLPVPPGLGRVHVTRSWQSGQGRVDANVHVHGAPLPESDLELLDGMLVTSIPRTVVDCARMLPLGRGVAMADAALHSALTTKEELGSVLAALGRRKGGPRARTVIELANGLAESPGESLSRVRFIDHGVPMPDLQRDLFTDDGTFVARVDFIWDEFDFIGEFDGKIKYGRGLRPGDSVADIIYEEKLREDAIRELGKGVVRWTWADIFSGKMVAKVRRTIDRHSS